MAVAADLTGRGDTAGTLALGAAAWELGADKAEIERARGGVPAASPLFVGHDGLPYKRAYAAVGEPGAVAGLVAVEGNADYYVALAAFRHRLLLAGALALLAVLALTALVARRISGPVVRLADAAARLGRGELSARIPVETRDEIGFLASTLDETRAALAARDERLQMMLAGIAHEVRNPLGGLELYAGLLRDALAGQPERLAEVGRIERELGHLRTVVSEFLEYARRPAPDLAPVAARPLLDEVRELTEAPAGVRVVVDAPESLAVRADVGQLRRALLNLARNAAAAMQERAGEIVLAARAEGDRVRLEVRDAGPGVPPDLRDKIFTPFFTTREKGTGLGLAFVREIVRDHGGDVSVGDAPGGGAVFLIDLPAAPAA
jgi:signal transduction histidine kinase